MKQIQAKSILMAVVILIIIGIGTTAAKSYSNRAAIADTLLTDSTVKNSMYVINNPLQVVFPEALEEHRAESKKYIRNYIHKERSYIKLMFRRGKNYMPIALSIFDKYDVPPEFRVLPALESNFSANAVSPVGAVGYWQFMAPLAKDYGLKIGRDYDERKNFKKSTAAAAKFFRDYLKLYDGDMLLVVAAYNCGSGRVDRSIRKSGKQDADFWDIKSYLPSETRKFVLRFIALNVVAANYTDFLNADMDFDASPTIKLANLDSMNAGIAEAPREL